MKSPNDFTEGKNDQLKIISSRRKKKQMKQEIDSLNIDFLKELHENFWIDKEHMVQHVKILDAMANAVENAAIVLILFSKSYQDSKNTRDEAEYTRKLNKPAIFLRVESKFVPSGWLGFIMGESRYIDFSGKYPFEEKFEELCTTIKNTRICMRFNVKKWRFKKY
ncbi:hypothetical protein Smp_014410.1 [Schistosoma mansoni]|uniref:hypothetical protein n=1 Tax=Schistosoma mansoni TaxID=6183 RepID=UPI0001A63CD5|nr:hypothetical protein Smp_014410.1 [Schistosoma mansoni]|eukprot:XP_018646028.1 hypothetical protein Smp_014410.1 [Schistosoma mansoni]